ncbi:transporter substrate-binding domain-containing protein [Polycladomyces sp. WAk]|uniref:Transporter substrate-binding domain-containing protein n=1 Tax=Polycladomyces zharkentensis TaxID=2807616 RepID=A0ABS2WN24_9BACL|nr:transporter substrate-binding domain-containing protein [Polycladomyces sp. WAk]MBN2910871.1 transporter substrate-binding domain-containing protein [Polycladomyces sp. WAk]
MKRWSLILITVLSMIFLAACGQVKIVDQSSSTDHLLDQIKKRGTIRFGTEGTYKPFSYHDEKTKQLVGFDIDVAKEVAKRLGVKAQFTEGPWDTLLSSLSVGRFDSVANQVGVKPERMKKFDFSKPYTVSYAVLVVHKDNKDIHGLADIKGKRAGQTPTSNYGQMAQKAGANLVSYEDMMTAMRDVAAKRVDVSINDRLAVAEMMKTVNLPVKVIPITAEKGVSAFPVPKGNKDLVAAINRALDDMRKDGTLAKISEKWFGQDITK